MLYGRDTIEDMYTDAISNGDQYIDVTMSGQVEIHSKCIQCPLMPSRHFAQSVRGPMVSLAFLELGEDGDQVAEPHGDISIGEAGAELAPPKGVDGVAGRIRMSGP